VNNKFAKFNTVFEEVRKNLQQKREDQEKRNTNTGYDDEYKLKATLPEKSAKITYEIRILPHVHSETGDPWVLGLYHMYRKPTGKFVYALCPTTFDKKAPCPFCEKANALFATKDKMDEEEARKIYKKKRYFCNVLVVKDERKGEDCQQGKVLVWEFGNQLFDKFVDALIDQKINFFHPVDGRNFNLTIKKKGEYPDYSMSSFSVNESAIAEGDAEMNSIFDQIYNLNDKVFSGKLHTYEKLKEIFENDEVKSSNSERQETTNRRPARDTSPVADTTVNDDDVVESVKKTEPVKVASAAKDSPAADDDFDFEDMDD